MKSKDLELIGKLLKATQKAVKAIDIECVDVDSLDGVVCELVNAQLAEIHDKIRTMQNEIRNTHSWIDKCRLDFMNLQRLYRQEVSKAHEFTSDMIQDIQKERDALKQSDD